jgi:nitrite reductase/ring-hydroxylating ferredoxin subunit
MSLDTWRAMVKLLRTGKARAVGVSNYTIQELQEILQNADVVPVVNQVEFHPFLYQKELLEFCGKNTIQLEAYSPLTRGKRLNSEKVANKRDFQKANLLRVEPDGKPIVLSVVDSNIYAMDAICTHEGATLEEGNLQEYSLTCPWHYAVFDVRNGKLLKVILSRT